MLDRMIKIFSEIKEDISKDCGHCDLHTNKLRRKKWECTLKLFSGQA